MAIDGALAALGYALAIGLLIGIERGWTERDEADGHRVAGVRTFGLLGLAGGVAAIIAPALGVTVLAIGGAIILTGYARQTRTDDGQSATGAVAGLLVLGLGVLAASGKPEAALAGAAVAMFLLSSRRRLHGLVRSLSAEEIRAAVQFAIIALVLFPLAPDRNVGPLGAINLHHVLLVVVLVCGASFAAYLAGRHVSHGCGPLLAATVGSLVSSTAVTVALARRLRSADGEPGTLASALLIASVVGGIRVLVLILLLAPDAFANAAFAIIPGLIALAISAIWSWSATPIDDDSPMPIGNPLELGAALAFAGVAVAATLGSRLATAALGSSGPFVVLTATGIADVDAAVLAFSSLSRAEQLALAAPALAAPFAANMLLKGGLTAMMARNRTGTFVAANIAASAIMIAGLSALLWYRS